MYPRIPNGRWKNKTGMSQKVKKQDWYHVVILKFPVKQVDLLSVRLDF